LWIKICGLTTTDAVAAAVNAGADAIGFVFAPSKRQVSAHQAATLCAAAPTHITRVAVMLHPTQSALDEVCEIFRPDLVQTDWQDFLQLRLPPQIAPLPVHRAAIGTEHAVPARLLFEGAHSGRGEVADWSQAQRLAVQTQVILAGGLNPANVEAALRAVKPFGVDVSSGVESAPGRKDPQLIEEFVRAARQAAHRTGER
jgi:phosphoribosylanthranilate isomerase